MPLIHEIIALDEGIKDRARASLTIYPRYAVELEAVVDDEAVDTAIIPNRVALVSAGHNRVAEASVTIKGAALPWHPSILEGVLVRR